MDRTAHWENVYATRREHEVGWYQARPEMSLRLIAQLGVRPHEAVIDVGGGASCLVDRLLERGFGDITVLDISAAALAAVKTRLGGRAGRVRWLAADVVRDPPPGPYRLWHDRAVFHFLVDAADRAAYVAALRRAVPVGGHVVMATFAADGPTTCSNLPVRRYDAELLGAELGAGFALLDAQREVHVTPAQGRQNFIYCCFHRQDHP